jgi:hypothetical protein
MVYESWGFQGKGVLAPVAGVLKPFPMPNLGMWMRPANQGPYQVLDSSSGMGSWK